MLAAALTLILANPLAGPGAKTHVLTGKRGPHSYRIEMKSEPFQVRGRKLVFIEFGENGIVGHNRRTRKGATYAIGYITASGYKRLHGEPPVQVDGPEGITPEQHLKNTTELASMKVVVDGKQWNVPGSLYTNIINPTFRSDHIWVELSKDGRTLDLGLTGRGMDTDSSVRWMFRKNGKHEFSFGPGC